jgi:hypothetical protein
MLAVLSTCRDVINMSTDLFGAAVSLLHGNAVDTADIWPPD